MAFDYTVTELPPVWPGGTRRTCHKKPAFKTPSWTRITQVLDRELRHLGARKVTIALELPHGGMDLRQDGKLLADARPRPPVILSFVDRDGMQHRYPCDTFGWWQDNLYAIAVVLEDLRRAERYGVSSQLIRAGFKALPGAGQSSATMGLLDAAGTIAFYSAKDAGAIGLSAEAARDAVRIAVFRTHPDRCQGDRTAFDLVDQARKIIGQHHGIPL